MMSFYIEESRDKYALGCCVCGALQEQGEGGVADEAQRADQGLENGDSHIIVSWKVVSVN